MFFPILEIVLVHLRMAGKEGAEVRKVKLFPLGGCQRSLCNINNRFGNKQSLLHEILLRFV